MGKDACNEYNARCAVNEAGPNAQPAADAESVQGAAGGVPMHSSHVRRVMQMRASGRPPVVKVPPRQPLCTSDVNQGRPSATVSLSCGRGTGMRQPFQSADGVESSFAPAMAGTEPNEVGAAVCLSGQRTTPTA